MQRQSGFTLIELLIVVAIIAILAAIAVPNFLEAQTRSKVSRAKADIRSLKTAVEAYRVDTNRLPTPFQLNGAGKPADWWGFTPPGGYTGTGGYMPKEGLTTPVAYMTSLPVMPFTDKSVLAYWKGWTGGTGTEANQPYTYIYRNYAANSGVFNPPSGVVGIPPTYNKNDALDFENQSRSASYVIYTCGPDGADGTVYFAPMNYDPTNGTVSYGDIYGFGAGTASETNSL